MKNRLFILKIILTIIVVIYLIDSIGLKNTYNTLIIGNMGYFIFACMLAPLFICIKTLKWHLMIHNAGAKEDFSTSFNAMLSGLGFGIFTPARAGEIMRIKYYKSVEKITLGGLVIIDRIIDIITILLLGIYFVLVQFGILSALSLLFICIFSLLMLGPLMNSYKLLPNKWKSKKLYVFLEKIGYGSNVLKLKNFSVLVIVSVFNWLLITLQFYFILNMYSSCNYSVALGSLPVIQLSNLIPVTIAGIGIREYLSVLVLQLYDVPNQIAAISAFFLFIIDIFIPGIIGLLLFGFRRNH